MTINTKSQNLYGIEEPHQCWFGKLTEIKFSKVNPKYDLAYIELFNGLYKICLKSELIKIKVIT